MFRSLNGLRKSFEVRKQLGTYLLLRKPTDEENLTTLRVKDRYRATSQETLTHFKSKVVSQHIILILQGTQPFDLAATAVRTLFCTHAKFIVLGSLTLLRFIKTWHIERYNYIYIYIYMQISLNIIDILCLHILFWIRSNSRITFIVFGGNWLRYCP